MTALTLNPDKWWVDHSPGMSENPGNPWRFNFPYGPDDYVTVARLPCALNLNDYSAVSMLFSIIGTDAIFNSNDAASPCKARLYFQRSDDRLMEGFEDYRWWSAESVDLINQSGLLLTQDFNPAHWFNVSGEWAETRGGAFDLALQNVINIGFSFGAARPDIGVWLSDGFARFQLDEFSLTDPEPEEEEV